MSDFNWHASPYFPVNYEEWWSMNTVTSYEPLIGVERLRERHAEKKKQFQRLLWTHRGHQLSLKIDRNICALCGSVRASHQVTESDNNGTCNLATPRCKNTFASFQGYQTPSNVSESLATAARVSERSRGSEGKTSDNSPRGDLRSGVKTKLPRLISISEEKLNTSEAKQATRVVWRRRTAKKKPEAL